MSSQPFYGGQAVIEGVMMRGTKRWAVAVRKANGEIFVHEEPLKNIFTSKKVLRLPFIRGSFALIDSLIIGVRSLMISANESEEGEEEEISSWAMALTMVIAFVLAMLVFVMLPTWAVNFLSAFTTSAIALNFVEGGTRIVLLILYMAAISKMEDIERVFAYHGAEHKVIRTWEAGEELTVENARKYSRFHPRCGTSFLFQVALISIIIYAFFGWPDFWQRLAVRILTLPLVAGLAYEALRMTARSNAKIVSWFAAPGLALQKLTTREPDDDMLEVAIKALENAFD